MIEIPVQRLSPEALEGLVEAFVLREGTDYGEREISLADKCDQVKRQLSRGEAVVVFDEESEACNLLTKEDYRQMINGR